MNISISELLVVLLIALLVIKPEQLPDVAFTVGRFAQSLRRMFAKLKTEMDSLMETADHSNEQKHK